MSTTKKQTVEEQALEILNGITISEDHERAIGIFAYNHADAISDGKVIISTKRSGEIVEAWTKKCLARLDIPGVMALSIAFGKNRSVRKLAQDYADERKVFSSPKALADYEHSKAFDGNYDVSADAFKAIAELS